MINQQNSDSAKHGAAVDEEIEKMSDQTENLVVTVFWTEKTMQLKL